MSNSSWFRQLKAADIVVPDNPGSHKGEAARMAIHAVGARLIFLPPCSPDLNPIEQNLRQAQDPAAKGRRAIR